MQELSAVFPKSLIINADGSDESILQSEAIDKNSAVICLTDRDEENTVIALYLKQYDVQKVILKINHINKHMVDNLDIGSVISPKNLTCGQITRFIEGLSHGRGGSVRTLFTLYNNGGERVEAIEFIAKPNDGCVNIPVKSLKIRKDALLGCVVRSGEIMIPSGETVIHAGDAVIVIVKNRNMTELDEIIEEWN